MFKEYMVKGTMNPEVQAVFKAAADISNGVFSLKEAAQHYKVHPAVIVQFISESPVCLLWMLAIRRPLFWYIVATLHSNRFSL